MGERTQQSSVRGKVRNLRNPQEEANRLLRSPPVGSAVGDEPPAGIQHVKGGHTDGETLIVGQRLVRQVGPLFDLIRHKDTQMPLTAAIYGPWGSGKTTAMRWLDRMLECWQKEGPKLIGNQHMTQDQFVDVRTVWFYPWKYQNRDDVLRGIIAEVIRATITVHGADAKTVQDAIRRFGGFLGRSFLSVLDSVELTGKVGGPGAEAGGKVDLGFAREIAEEFDRTNHPEKAFLNHFEETLCAWTRRTIPKGKRLVVFIDDLDRCLPRIALQVLEALKLYLRVPEVIFVVGVDRDVIARLVDKIYTEDQVQGVDAARYLAKMFQVEVTLDAEEELAGGFFEHVTRGHDVWAMLKCEPAPRDLLRRYILHHADRNPREIKRLFNGVMMAAVGHLHDAGGPDHGDEAEVARCLLGGARRFLIRHRLEFKRSEVAAGLRRARQDFEQDAAATEHDQYDACVHAIGTRFFTAFCDDWSKAALDEDAELDEQIRRQVNFEPFVFLLDDRWLDRVVQLGFKPPANDSDIADPKPGTKANPLAREDSGRLRPAIPVNETECGGMPGTPQRRSGKITGRPPTPKLKDLPDPAACRSAILAAETDELRTIRDAVALAVNERPEDLTEAHLLACERLNLNESGVTDLTPIAGLTALTLLDLNGTGVTDLTPISGLNNLGHLHLQRTSVVDLTPIARLQELGALALGGSDVADLMPIARLQGLTFLDLSQTGVTDLTPIAGLTKLQMLHLGGTGVAELTPIANLRELKFLFLSGTRVVDLAPIAGLNQLELLDLSNIGLGAEHVAKLRVALPECEIRS